MQRVSVVTDYVYAFAYASTMFNENQLVETFATLLTAATRLR